MLKMTVKFGGILSFASLNRGECSLIKAHLKIGIENWEKVESNLKNTVENRHKGRKTMEFDAYKYSTLNNYHVSVTSPVFFT